MQLRHEVSGFSEAGLDPARLEERRQRIMVLAFRRYPARYTSLSLEYIGTFSDNPRGDLAALHRSLVSRGFAAEAEQVRSALVNLER